MASQAGLLNYPPRKTWDCASRTMRGPRRGGARPLELGPPGTPVRVEYELETAGARFASRATWLLVALGCTLAALAAQGGSHAGWVFAAGAGVAAVCFARALGSPRGEVVLGDATLAIGPLGRTRTTPFDEVAETIVVEPTPALRDGRVMFVAMRRSNTRGLAAVGSALLPLRVAREIAARVELRRVAHGHAHPRAAAAFEAYHAAGPDALGVIIGAECRPFFSTRELVAPAIERPYRAGAPFEIAMRGEVWDALCRTQPEIAARLALVVRFA